MPARPLKPIPVQPVWPRPASSVLVLAPMHSPQAAQPRAAQAQPQTDYSVLMLRRSSRGFFGGLSVFPGGVLEASDNLAVWRSKILPNYGGFTKSILKELEDDVLHDYEVLFARGDPESKKLDGEQRRDWGLGLLIAAIRETFEECGLALFKPHIDWLEGRKGTRTERKEVAEIWRKKVHDDAGMFVELCEKFRVAPDVGKLRFWSNWNTPETEIKRYDAHFFLTILDHPVGASVSDSEDDALIHPYVEADGTETLEFNWVTPTQGLDKFASGQWEMVEPQFCQLSELERRYPTLKDVKPYFEGKKRTRLETLKNCPEFYLDDSRGKEEQVLVFTLDRLHTRTPSLTGMDPAVSQKETDQYRVVLDYDVEGTVQRMVFKGMEYVREVEGFGGSLASERSSGSPGSVGRL